MPQQPSPNPSSCPPVSGGPVGALDYLKVLVLELVFLGRGGRTIYKAQSHSPLGGKQDRLLPLSYR